MINIRRFSGFTLVELMVTVAIAAILLVVAAPSFTTLISGSNADSYTKKLRSTFAYARNEAVSRGGNVRVCASVDTLSCSANAAAWGNGWIVYFDADNDGVLDAGEEIRVEALSQLSVDVSQQDDNGVATAFSAVCFSRLGRECAINVSSVIFTADANGQQSIARLYNSGVVFNN